VDNEPKMMDAFVSEEQAAASIAPKTTISFDKQVERPQEFNVLSQEGARQRKKPSIQAKKRARLKQWTTIPPTFSRPPATGSIASQADKAHTEAMMRKVKT